MGEISPPVPLDSTHHINDFNSGEISLDEFLKRKALKNQQKGASRCFVICKDKKVVGYYTLSAGAIGHSDVQKPMRRNMPDPLPILLIGRLAIDREYHNHGLGSALLKDAILRSVNISLETGVFAVLVHALSEDARKFYLSRGFVPSPIQPMTLMMTLETIKQLILESHH